METDNGLIVYYEKTQILQNNVNRLKRKLIAKKKKVSKLNRLIESTNLQNLQTDDELDDCPERPKSILKSRKSEESLSPGSEASLLTDTPTHSILREGNHSGNRQSVSLSDGEEVLVASAALSTSPSKYKEDRPQHSMLKRRNKSTSPCREGRASPEPCPSRDNFISTQSTESSYKTADSELEDRGERVKGSEDRSRTTVDRVKGLEDISVIDIAVSPSKLPDQISVQKTTVRGSRQVRLPGSPKEKPMRNVIVDTQVKATCSSFIASSPSLKKKTKSFVPPFKKRKENEIGACKPEAPSTLLSQEIDPLQNSPDSIPLSPSLMISPVLPLKLASLEEDEIDDDVENDSNEYVPDLDKLLKLPERPADGSKTKDEILDEFDRQIAERQRLHEEEMVRVEADIEAENLKRIQRKLRLKENAKLRNRLETELTETRLRSIFKDNLEYLKDIWSGKVESWRHQAYQSGQTRHALYYQVITDPFTEDQHNWMMDEISKTWMRNRKEEMDNKDYVWKVLVSECYIKIYMDFFNVSKHEAMTRISETPLHKKDRLREYMSKSDLEEESEEE